MSQRVCVLYLHHTGLGRVLSVPPVTGSQAVLHTVCHHPKQNRRTEEERSEEVSSEEKTREAEKSEEKQLREEKRMKEKK